MEKIVVTRFFYKLNGVCQASLVEANDGNIYVLKMAGPEGANHLFNEVLGSELLRHCKLPVSRWAALTLSDEFIDANTEMWLKHNDNAIRPPATVHFGSRLITAKGKIGSFEIIPSSWASRVINARDFAGILAIDIWANHCDRRQVIFTRTREDLLHATFVDHDHMFGGPEIQHETCPRRAMISDLRLYQGLPMKQLFTRWIRKIRKVDEQTLKVLIREIPVDWYSEDRAFAAIEMLESRRSRLPALFNEALSVLAQQRPSPSNCLVNSRNSRFELDSPLALIAR